MHDHSHDPGADAGGKSLLAALVLNLGITAAQIIGGIVSGSLSLLADAAHNGSDAAALGISYAAQRISRRPADEIRTFGYRRAEVVGALINLTTLFVIAAFLIFQAADRLISPPEVHGATMMIVGAIALVEDGISAWLLYRASRGSLNIRSAFIHMVGDSLATVGVLVGGFLIAQYGVQWIDPAITAAIALYLIAHGYLEIRKTIRILMESAPADFDLRAMVSAVEALDGVEDMHHVHVWRLDEQRIALEAHLCVEETDLEAIEEIKARVKRALLERYGVEHSTLEVEIAGRRTHERETIAPE